MGRRGVLDFVLFYAYMAFGAVLSLVHFNVLYPIARWFGALKRRRRDWWLSYL